MTPSLGIEPRPHWWKASALTTAPSLHPNSLDEESPCCCNSLALCNVPSRSNELCSSLKKFGFINGVDNVNWPPYRDSMQLRTEILCRDTVQRFYAALWLFYQRNLPSCVARRPLCQTISKLLGISKTKTH